MPNIGQLPFGVVLEKLFWIPMTVLGAVLAYEANLLRTSVDKLNESVIVLAAQASNQDRRMSDQDQRMKDITERVQEIERSRGRFNQTN